MIRADFLKRVEWITAILLTATCFWILWVRIIHAGALWRDESGTVALAAMPTLSEVMEYFDHQTFPPLVPLLVRCWIRLFGDSDVALRSFGFAAGVAFSGATWLSARVAGRGVPLLSIALFGLSPLFLTWGTTVSGYGFGAALIVLTLAMNAKLIVHRTPAAILGVFIAVIASQQLVVSNLTLVLTIGLSALIVTLVHRDLKTASVLAGVIICAVVIGTIYLKIFLNAEWRILFQHPPTVSDLWRKFTQACAGGSLLIWIGRACFVTIVANGIWHWRESRTTTQSANTAVLQLALLAALLSPIAYFGALLLAGYRTHEWHYLLLLALLPIALDMIVIAASPVYWLRIARLIFAITATATVAIPTWSAAHQRETNIDLAAAKLHQLAKPGDLIVVAPWQLGISFQRYYHGQTRWTTLPTIADHRIHRYDLMLTKMISPHPIDDVLENVSHTLASGNRVWFVGEMRLPDAGQPPLLLRPAPNDRFGWDESAYSESWLEQISNFLHAHSEHRQTVPVPQDQISPFEDVPLTVIDGWQ